MKRKRIFYFLLMLAMSAFSFFYDEQGVYMAAIILFIMPVFSFIYALCCAGNISCKLSTQSDIVAKSKTNAIYIDITNKSVFPVAVAEIVLVRRNLFSDSVQKNRYFTSAGARTTRRIKCETEAYTCGNIEYKAEKVYVYDMLGIFRFKVKSDKNVNVAVLPDIYECGNLRLHDNIESFMVEDKYSSVKSGDDPSELFDVRKFEQGDKLNRIHWKLSAKQGELMTKEFGLPLDYSTMIFIELCAGRFEKQAYADIITEAAAAISVKLTEMKRRHFIAWYDRKSNEIKRYMISDLSGLYEALGALYRMTVDEGRPNGIKMYEAVYGIEKYSDLYYISVPVTHEEYDVLQGIKKGGSIHLISTGTMKEIKPAKKKKYRRKSMGREKENISKTGISEPGRPEYELYEGDSRSIINAEELKTSIGMIS